VVRPDARARSTRAAPASTTDRILRALAQGAAVDLLAVQMSREELEQRLRRAVEVRRTLRRASLRLMKFGEELLRARYGASKSDVTEPR
jgi:hypothetical protein